MRNIENNLFKATLVGVLAMGCFASINDKVEISKPTYTVAQTKNETPIQQVIIIGKRLPKHDELIAKR